MQYNYLRCTISLLFFERLSQHCYLLIWNMQCLNFIVSHTVTHGWLLVNLMFWLAEFVQVFSPSHVKMRVWERGAGLCFQLLYNHAINQSDVGHLTWLLNYVMDIVIVGATLACGTGACAVVVAAVLEGRAGRVSWHAYLKWIKYHVEVVKAFTWLCSQYFLTTRA